MLLLVSAIFRISSVLSQPKTGIAGILAAGPRAAIQAAIALVDAGEPSVGHAPTTGSEKPAPTFRTPL
jgi:hypothetical protein